MAPHVGLWWFLAATGTLAQLSITDDRTTRTDFTLSLSQTTAATSLYQSFGTQITQDASVVDNATRPGGIRASPTNTVTFLTGSAAATSHSGNASSTISPADESANTQPCNNYVEFCSRQYSNITEVSTHNSPFITPKNIAANQQYDVIQQLDDGVRFLQAQIQWPGNATDPHFCHTSCDLLDAGPISDWLRTVKKWVVEHPFDVVTILLGNGNYSDPALYAPHIEHSGILKYVYQPPYIPMNSTTWPPLSEMILSSQRVVMFIDYMANQTAFPWLMDQFTHMWETPFDPTNNSFPSTIERPPGLSVDDAKTRLSLMNHNLNIQLSVLGTELLIPARSELNITNNATGAGSLGNSANNFLEKWGRPPTFLNVDYYNYGGYPGSVFEVAAQMNNVTYRRPCCGPRVKNSGLTVHTDARAGVAYSVALVALIWALL
ncbi:PLC-like phosphodiesterase [Xylaria sp. CBS 124048]|nr:PLC-like phosphodiesterase [Xylaria sp. CBS 124048]